MRQNFLIAFLVCCISLYLILVLLSRPSTNIDNHHHHHHLKLDETKDETNQADQPCSQNDYDRSGTAELFQMRRSLMASICQNAIDKGTYPKEFSERIDQIVEIFKKSKSVSYGFFVDEANEDLMCLFVSPIFFSFLS